MSYTEKKKKISEVIKTYVSLRDEALRDGNVNLALTDFLTNNSQDVIKYILSLVKDIKGEEIIKIYLTDVLVKLLPDYNQLIRDTLKNALTSDIDEEPIPNSFYTDGINIKLKDVDKNNDIKEDTLPDFQKDLESFERKIYESVNSGGLTFDFPRVNPLLTLAYIKDNETINIKPKFVNNKKDFIHNLIDSVVFINTPKIIYDIMDLLFGSVKFQKKYSRKQYYDDEVLNYTLNNLLSTDNITDKAFEINEQQLGLINKKTDQLLNGGSYLDFNCDYKVLAIDYNQVLNLINDDVNNFVNNLDIEITENLTDIPDEVATDDLSQQDLLNSNTELRRLQKNQDVSASLSFVHDDLIKSIVIIIVKNTIFGVIGAMIINLFNKLNNIQDSFDINNIRRLIKCVLPPLKDKLTEFLFELLKKEIQLIIIPLAKKILKEKLKNSTDQITSLTQLNRLNNTFNIR